MFNRAGPPPWDRQPRQKAMIPPPPPNGPMIPPPPSSGLNGYPCVYSHHCQERYQVCKLTSQDAFCVCNNYQCVFQGAEPFPIALKDGLASSYKQCDTWRDCTECSSDPRSCFCINRRCKKERWECHSDEYGMRNDCARYYRYKCDNYNKKCQCTGNTCEHQCNYPNDCYAKRIPWCSWGQYACRCENNLCVNHMQPRQCANIQECVNKGLCLASRPCACTEGMCTKPWWYVPGLDIIECRNDRDCNETITFCRNNQLGCVCRDIKPINGNPNKLFGICQPRR